MDLRKKLFTTFFGLGLMVLTVVGATLWTSNTWQNTNSMLEDHYKRSLLVQEIETTVYRAVKEIPDALTNLDDDAATEFKLLIAPVDKRFDRWAALAHTKNELNQVKLLRTAVEDVLKDSKRVLELQNTEGSLVAAKYMEEQLDGVSLFNFQEITDEAIASDRAYGKSIQERVNWIRRTDRMISAIATFGTISLLLLLFAYVSGDLFAPLRMLTSALKAVAAGDYKQSLPAERNDELGEVDRAFNRMVEAIAERQRLNHLTISEDVTAKSEHPWRDTPSRLTLHRQLFGLKEQVQQISQRISDRNNATSAKELQAITDRLDNLLATVVQFTELGFPLDLNLEQFHVPDLLYETLLRFHAPFAKRAVGFEIDVSPDVGNITGDRQKMRQVLGEIIRNALVVLPEKGGHVGIRASIADDGKMLRIEVVDDGKGADPNFFNRSFSLEDDKQFGLGIGLGYSRLIVEQHGGTISIHSQPEGGNYVRITFPA